jgi:hypothetical protein
MIIRGMSLTSRESTPITTTRANRRINLTIIKATETIRMMPTRNKSIGKIRSINTLSQKDTVNTQGTRGMAMSLLSN